MTTLINKESTQHYANKMVLAENRKVGSKSLPAALNEIDALIDEMKTYFDAEYGSALDMKLNNNENVFSVGTETNIDKRSEVENSFTDVELNGNSLVNLLDYRKTTTQNLKNNQDGTYTLSKISWDYNITASNHNVIKPNTIYSLIIDVTNWTYSGRIQFRNSLTALIPIIANTFDINKEGRFLILCRSAEQLDYSNSFVVFKGDNPATTTGGFTIRPMLLEGDWTNKPLPQYFQGLKSVGEKEDGNHKISIASFNNGNVIVNPTYKTGFYVSLNNGVEQINNDYSCTDFIRIENNKKIRVINTNFNIAFYNKDKKNIPIKVQDLSGRDTDFTTITPKESYYVRFSTANNAIGTEGCFYGDSIGDINMEIRLDKKEILLNEPLRGLPNGTRDTIEKINGEWKIVRRCAQVNVNGSEHWKVYQNLAENNKVETISFTSTILPIAINNEQSSRLLCNNFKGITHFNKDVEGVFVKYNNDLRFSIKRSKLVSEDVNGFKEWLSQNPTKVIYELATPIIENISPVTLQCWKNGTISIDEVLPVETNHIVALNKPAQIKRNIEELTVLRKRVQALEDFYDKIALEQAYQLDLINHSYELDYNR